MLFIIFILHLNFGTQTTSIPGGCSLASGCITLISPSVFIWSSFLMSVFCVSSKDICPSIQDPPEYREIYHLDINLKHLQRYFFQIILHLQVLERGHSLGGPLFNSLQYIHWPLLEETTYPWFVDKLSEELSLSLQP